MAPPVYSQLGKKHRDIFTNGYHFGLIKLDLKTKTESGVEFTSGLVHNQETGKVFGALASKYKIPDLGVTLQEKWTTDNVLLTDVVVQDKLLEGLKLGVEASFAPQTGKKSGWLRAQFGRELFMFNTDVNLIRAGPVVDAGLVLKYENWLAGFQTGFDTQNQKMTRNNISLGFTKEDFELHTHVDNGNVFGGGIFQKVNEELSCGVTMKWTSADEARCSQNTVFGIGAVYKLDENTHLRAKVNNQAQIGLGFQQKLREGATLSLSAQIDAQNFNAGGHKLGLGIELEPK